MSVDWSWQPPRRRRRWPYLLVLVAVLAAGVLGVAGGAARSTADAAGDAAERSARGDFAGAATLYLQIAGRGGPLYLMARGTVSEARLQEQRTLLVWARALAAKGRVDDALRVNDGVTDPSLLAAAHSERSTLLLEAARAALSAGDFATAQLRDQQLERIAAGTPFAAQAEALLPEIDVDQAKALVAARRGADAVTLLDQAAQLGSADRAAISAVLPAALLAAAREEAADLSYMEAVASLQRVVRTFPRSPQAASARSMLDAPQPVAGTLTDRRGIPISGQVRLSSNFRNVGGGYLTSGPFYYSSADGNGDFVVSGVPQGGPYVLEFFHNGDWTTLIDPSSGRPADPVNVTPLQPVDLTFIVLPS